MDKFVVEYEWRRDNLYATGSERIRASIGRIGGNRYRAYIGGREMGIDFDTRGDAKAAVEQALREGR